MSSRHLVSYADLTLLRDIYPYRFAYSRRKLIGILSCKYLCVDNYTIGSVRHLEGSIPYLSCLFSEYGP